jgi:hypothetical protein
LATGWTLPFAYPLAQGGLEPVALARKVRLPAGSQHCAREVIRVFKHRTIVLRLSRRRAMRAMPRRGDHGRGALVILWTGHGEPAPEDELMLVLKAAEPGSAPLVTARSLGALVWTGSGHVTADAAQAMA